MACAALMRNSRYFDGRARFYFGLCAAATASSKINKPISVIAEAADVDYRQARRYLAELVETGEIIRSGEPRKYKYEVNEFYSWHGSEESRNDRIQRREQKHLERVIKKQRTVVPFKKP